MLEAVSKIAGLLSSNRPYTVDDVVNITGLPERTAKRVLPRLVRAGLVHPTEKQGFAIYQSAEAAILAKQKRKTIAQSIRDELSSEPKLAVDISKKVGATPESVRTVLSKMVGEGKAEKIPLGRGNRVAWKATLNG